MVPLPPNSRFKFSKPELPKVVNLHVITVKAMRSAFILVNGILSKSNNNEGWMMKSNLSFLTPRELEALDKVLMTWGALTRYAMNDASGSNMLHASATLGVRISSSRQEPQWPYEVERVDELINKLHRVKSKWANAVKWHYMEPGDIRQQARARGLAKSTYHEQCQKGKHWIGRKLYQLH